MLSHEQIVSKSIANFSKRKLRKGIRLAVANNSDLRIADFDFESTVMNNWPSQGHSHFPAGYLKFSNGKIFDLHNVNISKKKKS